MRRCLYCHRPMSDDADARALYCSERHREAAAAKRRRAKNRVASQPSDQPKTPSRSDSSPRLGSDPLDDIRSTPIDPDDPLSTFGYKD